MIFAAGLGTRLRPLTDDKPKALVSVGGVTMLANAVGDMARAGIRDIVVNVHSFADMMCSYIAGNQRLWDSLGCTLVVSDERDCLMDTGGGLAKALPLFPTEAPVVVRNVDVFCDYPLDELYRHHVANGADATLLTDQTRSSSRNLIFDSHGLLSGWRNLTTGDVKLVGTGEQAWSEPFNGIHVVSQRLIKQMLPAKVEGLTTTYLSLASTNRIMRWPMDGNIYQWFDAGTPERVSKIEREYRSL